MRKSPKLRLHKPSGRAYIRVENRMIYFGKWGVEETEARYHAWVAELALVATMCNANPLLEAPRIHGEMLKFGLEISERSISEILRRHRPKQPSQTWKTFIKNHKHEALAMDFIIVPTERFRALLGFNVMNHATRKVVHFNVTDHPCAEWTEQQMRETFPWDTAPRFLIRDRGLPYSGRFREAVQNMGDEEIITARRWQWQSGYMERLIGSVRRKCFDHVIIWSEAHLRRVLKDYFAYYDVDRTHLRLGKETTKGRPSSAELASTANLVALPRLGGLHHRYEWSQVAWMIAIYYLRGTVVNGTTATPTYRVGMIGKCVRPDVRILSPPAL